jgi:LmbE family N-acetylglucosaminyl deacetylase
MSEAMAVAGIEGPGTEDGADGPPVELGTPDEQIGAVIDVTSVVDKKRAALAAHGSQTADSFFLTMPDDLFAQFMGREAYVRVQDPSGQQGVEVDLLAGTGSTLLA